jgi:DNA-binding NarL/FixJ family response regulator
MRVRTISREWLLVHAAHLHSSVDADITVIIEPAQPSRIAPLILNSLGLTLRESEVPLRMRCVKTTKAIGTERHLPTYTVKDHLQSSFDKTGVRSRVASSPRS